MHMQRQNLLKPAAICLLALLMALFCAGAALAKGDTECVLECYPMYLTVDGQPLSDGYAASFGYRQSTDYGPLTLGCTVASDVLGFGVIGLCNLIIISSDDYEDESELLPMPDICSLITITGDASFSLFPEADLTPYVSCSLGASILLLKTPPDRLLDYLTIFARWGAGVRIAIDKADGDFFYLEYRLYDCFGSGVAWEQPWTTLVLGFEMPW